MADRFGIGYKRCTGKCRKYSIYLFNVWFWLKNDFIILLLVFLFQFCLSIRLPHIQIMLRKFFLTENLVQDSKALVETRVQHMQTMSCTCSLFWSISTFKMCWKIRKLIEIQLSIGFDPLILVVVCSGKLMIICLHVYRSINMLLQGHYH